MATASPTKTVETPPNATQPCGESREEKLAGYSSPEFTEALLEHFHEAKRRALADIRGEGLVPATESEAARR